MGYPAPKMFFPKDVFGKLIILGNAFLDCHSHLSKHQGDQAPSTRSGYKSEDIMRMQVTGVGAKAPVFVVDLDHQRLENQQ